LYVENVCENVCILLKHVYVVDMYVRCLMCVCC